MDLNEIKEKMDFMGNEIDEKVKMYEQKYESQLDCLHNDSLLSKCRPITAHDTYALCQQFEMFEQWVKFCEVSGNLNKLGRLPIIGLDVITAVHGSTVLPIIASVQPIKKRRGLIWFEQTRAGTTRGNRTAGDLISDSRKGATANQSYASSKIPTETVVPSTTGAQVSYTFILAKKPILSQTLKITTDISSAIYAEDVGVRGTNPDEGTLLGIGMSGLVNYISGSVTIKLDSDPGSGAKIFADYQENLELANDIASITGFLDSTDIMAHPYALKGTLSMFQQFELAQEFGNTNASDMLAQRLLLEINNEIGTDAILMLRNAAQGSTDFSRTLPSGVNVVDHKASYVDTMFDAEVNFLNNAGRGTMSVMIVGRKHAAYVAGVRGFKVLNDSRQFGPHIWGKLGNVIYIRVPDTSIIAEDGGIGLHKGDNFAAPLVHSPYMPMTVTDLLPEVPNPLGNQRAAARMDGLKIVIGGFITEYKLIS